MTEMMAAASDVDATPEGAHRRA